MGFMNNSLGLELTVDWPKPIREVGLLHVKWMAPTATELITAYHPRCVAFENELKEYRKHAKQNIMCKCIFKLPFAVQKDMAAQYNMIL